MSKRFSENPNYVEYERLLIQLHKLIVQGGGDDEEAEEVREEMDLPGCYLHEDEVTRLKKLSADLCLLNQREIYELRFVGSEKI